MSLLNTLLFNDDLLALPTRLASGFLLDRKAGTYLPMIVRALIAGAVLALLRRAFRHFGNQLGRALFPTAYIPASDPAFTWVMAWIASDPSAQKQISDFQLFTSDWRSVKRKAKNALMAAPPSGTSSTSGDKGNVVGQQNATWVQDEVIGQVVPTYHQAIRLKHNGRYLWITRKVGLFARSSYRSVDHLQIRTIAFQPDVIKSFLAATHQSFFAKEDTELLIFHPKRINPTWQLPVSRPSRPWSSVILPGTIKEDVLKDVQRFLSDKEIKWYASRGIPHRRGYLLHGVPGSGKTSLVTALASKLRLDIYVINPAQRGYDFSHHGPCPFAGFALLICTVTGGRMDDAKLNKLFRDCPAKSVILIEDIDCIFLQNRMNAFFSPPTSTTQQDDNEGGTALSEGNEPVVEEVNSPVVPNGGNVGGGGAHDLAPSTVTMSGLLNALDGVASFEQCVLVATTNHVNRLDPALSRAGRFDVRIAFSSATWDQARALYLHFYPLEDYSATQTSPSDDASTTNPEEEKTIVAPRSSAIGSEEERKGLADEFANAIFLQSPNEEKDHEQSMDSSPPIGSSAIALSMASLQSYLLTYKDDPVGAVKNAQVWAKEWTEQEIKMTQNPTPRSIANALLSPVPKSQKALKGK